MEVTTFVYDDAGGVVWGGGSIFNEDAEYGLAVHFYTTNYGHLQRNEEDSRDIVFEKFAGAVGNGPGGILDRGFGSRRGGSEDMEVES